MLPLNYFLFLQIILFLFITPGTPRIVIISYSMNYGVQKCIWTALGDVTANFIQATLVIFVLGSFFVDNPNFLNIFKWIGIVYLLYLAYDIYNSRPKDINSNNISSKSFFSFFKDGFLVAGTSFGYKNFTVKSTVIGIIIGVLLVNVGFYLLKKYINQRFNEKQITSFKSFFEYTLVFLVIYFVLF